MNRQQIYDTNLCKEILLTAKAITNSLSGVYYAPYIPMIKFPEPKYKFTRANWYVAEFDDRYYFEVEKWCAEQFGPHPKAPDAWCRWFHRYSEKIHFRDEKDYLLFLLRWGV